MRCISCDTRLTHRESCTRFRASGNFTELCSACLKTMNASTISPNRDFDEQDDDEIPSYIEEDENNYEE